MLDPTTQNRLKTAVYFQIDQDMGVLAGLRGEIEVLRSSIQRINEQTTTSMSLVGTDGGTSYLSNQCPRTYAPKPRYAVNYWNRHRLRPPRADIRTVVERRAVRHYAQTLSSANSSRVLLADS